MKTPRPLSHPAILKVIQWPLYHLIISLILLGMAYAMKIADNNSISPLGSVEKLILISVFFFLPMIRVNSLWQHSIGFGAYGEKTILGMPRRIFWSVFILIILASTLVCLGLCINTHNDPEYASMKIRITAAAAASLIAILLEVSRWHFLYAYRYQDTTIDDFMSTLLANGVHADETTRRARNAINHRWLLDSRPQINAQKRQQGKAL